MISAAHMQRGMLLHEKILKKCTISFVLVYIFSDFVLKLFLKCYLCIEQVDVC